ncbi:hypothetical protein [Ascidiimonas sp. W6]|uniref:hypothetical protein n=1 Tax=Ascidiimonas meishanensis TaxID=3128903 RepID=UPI0030EC9C49
MKKLMLVTIGCMFLFACGGGGDGDDGGGGGNVTPPSAATLIFPENNTECNEGTILSASQSRVTFRWNAAQNADSYGVILRNLETNQLTNSSATTNTNIDITISRGTPYSWQVESRANGTSQTARSETFRFYNAGEPIENFAPFPAAAVAPNIGETVDGSSGSITLRWSGSDIDNDISQYDIFFGTANPPTNLQATQAGTTLNVNVTASTVYFWQVVTRDAEGNTSTSELFQFKTN